MRSRASWLGAATAVVYLLLFAPVAVVVLLAFNRAEFAGWPLEGVTLDWFARLAGNEAVGRAAMNSWLLGSLSAAIATAIAMAAALALTRFRVRGQRWITGLMVMPILVPEVVLGVALLLFLRWASVPRSFAVLLLGHVLIALPFAFLVLQARLAGLGRTLEDAARTLGAGPVATFFKVTLPLSWPAVLAAVLFAFTISFDNATATLFWKPPGIETVPTQVFAMLRHSVSPEINALGAVMIAVTVALPLIATTLARRFAGTTRR